MIKGIIGKKLGMSRTYTEDGALEAVTAIEAGPCIVTQVKTESREGYNAIQLGFGKKRRLNSPEKGHLKGSGMFERLAEFRVDGTEETGVGSRVDASIFKTGDTVDIIGVSKGKGFAGVVKRHHFRGGPKTHGQSDRTRAPGAIGSTTTPGRVYKGLRMAGHMGNARVTVRNVKVVRSDAQTNLLLVAGSVPGAKNGLVLVQKSPKQG